MKDSTNYPNSQTARHDSKRPANVLDFLLFEFRIGLALPAHLLVSTLAVIVSPSFITNGTVCYEMTNICQSIGLHL